MSQTSAAAADSSPLMTQRGPRDRSHPVRLYVERVASQDLGDYPDWDLTVRIYAIHHQGLTSLL